MKKLYLIVAAGLLLVPCVGQGMNNAADQDLLAAARNNNLEDMQAALEASANVDVVTVSQETSLYWAVMYKNVEMVNILLGAGANVNVANEHGWTPLYVAANNNNLEMVNALVGAGANVNITSYHGYTTLYAATRKDYLEMVNLLLDAQGIEYDMVNNTLALLQNDNINNPCIARIQEWLDNFDAGLK